ncbi:uncharacterized mitochondrial protein-like protein [Tanacetum coccineum]
MSSMGELTFFLGLQVKQKPNGIFISQDKYVDEILKKFDFANVKSASTPIETQKPLVKDEEASDVDVHLYRSMIGSLIFKVTPKTSHLTAVKRIFRYLKGKPKLGLWYPRESTFDLESYSDSDYAGANLDRKSTTGGCQFLGRRLITWQCKKQTIVATSTTEAEYVAAASCCGQVLWIQNQMSPKPIRIHFNRTITHAISSTDILDLQALISLTDDLSLRSNMAALESCPKHNMIAYLEKTEGNVEFHEVIDFLQRSYISHALTNAKGDGKAKENAQREGRTKEMMDEDKETDEVGLSTKDEVSTAKKDTDETKWKVNDDQVDVLKRSIEGTEEPKRKYLE